MCGDVLFMKIRRCPLCLFKNSDENQMETGSLGASVCKTAIWAKGTSAIPEGPVDKLCQMVYTMGGFAVQHSTLEDFVAARKQIPQLMKEWVSAWGSMKAYLESSEHQRLGKCVQALIQNKISEVRAQTVEAFPP